MTYPLKLRFKRIALARQLSVEDSSGRLLMYVKQKAFKLREAITVFADREQTNPLYYINADRVIDFSATYQITDGANTRIGSVRQQGMRSLWRARFTISRDGAPVFELKEENPWSRVGDHFFGEIPIVGIFAGYIFNPSYLISTADGTDVLRITKKPAFLEGVFEISRLPAPLSAENERLLLIGAVSVVVLEKNRG
jgi:uncharacterized protein YxjI